MCLAVPGKVVSISSEDPLLRAGKVDFGGVLKEANLAYVPEAGVGDYVVVHAGFAISRLDEEEANKVFEYLRAMEELSELEEANSRGALAGNEQNSNVNTPPEGWTTNQGGRQPKGWTTNAKAADDRKAGLPIKER